MYDEARGRLDDENERRKAAEAHTAAIQRWLSNAIDQSVGEFVDAATRLGVPKAEWKEPGRFRTKLVSGWLIYIRDDLSSNGCIVAEAAIRTDGTWRYIAYDVTPRILQYPGAILIAGPEPEPRVPPGYTTSRDLVARAVRERLTERLTLRR